MKQLACLILAAAIFPLVAARGAGDRPALFVPEGQLLSEPVTIYVANTNLTDDAKPTLTLTGVHSLDQPSESEQVHWSPSVTAPGQEWTETVAGRTVSCQGTMLIFDLSSFQEPWYKAAIRLTPSLTWNSDTNQSPNAGPTTLFSGTPVYLGRMMAAIIWTIIVVGFLVVMIGYWATKKGSPVYLICGEDKYLSLWRTQLVAWTLAVGSLVFCFGLIHLEVPQIPDTLVALMGMSVATGGFSSLTARSQWHAQLRDGVDPKVNPGSPSLSDLITSYSPVFKDVELSVPKAQMVFWTGIILVLFVTKSLLTGGLWEVPWEMVALTGVSQAGYIGDKATKGRTPKRGKPADADGKNAQPAGQ